MGTVLPFRPPPRKSCARCHPGADRWLAGKLIATESKASAAALQEVSPADPGWRVVRRNRPTVFIALLSDALAEASGWRHR
jgi:hypothetical protein